MADADIVTSIEELESGIWRGTAELGSRNLVWRYEARSGWLKILEQDTRNQQCWRFIVRPAQPRGKSAGSWPEPFGVSTSASACEAPASIVPEGKPPAPDRTCKAAEARTTGPPGLRSRALGGRQGGAPRRPDCPVLNPATAIGPGTEKRSATTSKIPGWLWVLGFGPRPAGPAHLISEACPQLRSPRPGRAPAAFLESWKGRRYNHACLTSAGANRLEASGQDPWTSSDLYARHGS